MMVHSKARAENQMDFIQYNRERKNTDYSNVWGKEHHSYVWGVPANKIKAESHYH